MKGRFDAFLPIIGVVGLLAVWTVAVHGGFVDPVLLPPPKAATEILVLSPTPNSTRNSGNIADAGVERKKSMTNSSER